jgi:hypothetical protein
MTTLRPLETITRTAPLGVRPWDAASGLAITDGLRLTELGRRTAATPNRSGVFVFHDLPGMRASADGAGDDAFWAAPPVAASFELELVDLERRFLPFRFGADAPARGLFVEQCPHAFSPPEMDVPGVPLFSAPSRPVPPGLAVVRAELWDVELDRPAAWAVLEITPAGAPPVRGIADELGRVLVLLAYPEPQWTGSSPPPGSRALADQTWSLDVGVRYDPAGSSPRLPEPGTGVAPDLCTVLAQAPATPLEALSPATPLTGATLAFGRQLMLRTPGRSVLLVSPA